MSSSSRIFTSTSLALVLAAWTGSSANPSRIASPSSDATPAALTSILRDYNTAASKRLQKLEVDFNGQRPSGVPPIVFLDYDKVSVWFGLEDGPPTVETAISDYLVAKTGRHPDASTLSTLARAMNSLDAEGIVVQKSMRDACLVVPQYPGISFHTAYAATFRVGQTDLLDRKAIVIDLSTKEFEDFVTAHELWHCLDVRYIRDSGDGLEGAVKRNRTEMFADVGAAMEVIRDGADLTAIDKLAAVHATWAFETGPAHLRMPDDSDEHFQSVAYATEDGLFVLKSEIARMGIVKFRELRHEQLRSLDYKITDAHCLTYEQAEALQTYFATGKEQAPARILIAGLKSIAARSVLDSTTEELAARATAAREGTSQPAAATQAAEQSLLRQLQARTRQLGNAESFRNQLQARQELTDSLRDKLLNERDPMSEQATEAQLNLLFYIDPHLLPRKGGIKPLIFSGAARSSHGQ